MRYSKHSCWRALNFLAMTLVSLTVVSQCLLSTTYVAGFLTSTTSPNVVVVESSSITLNCRTNASSDPLRWNYYSPDTDIPIRLYSGSKVHPDFVERIQVAFDKQEGIGTLNINRALLADAGIYECLEHHSAVHAIRFQLISVHNPMCSINATESDVVVSCTVVFIGNTTPLVLSSPGPGNEQKSFDTIHNRVTYYKRITDWQTNDTIQVTCQTTIPGFSSYVNSWTFYIVRTKKLIDQPSNPRIIEHPEDQYVAINESATLNCKVDGAPPSLITWYRNGVPVVTADKNLTSHRVLMPNGQLFFLHVIHGNNVSSPDVGIYYCNATNPETKVSVISKNATLEIASLGTDFRKHPHNVELPVGAEATLECLPPEGEPQPRVRWRKNNDPVKYGDRWMIMEIGSLRIRDVHLEDSGTYVCIAYNIGGERESNPARLVIKGLAPASLTGFALVSISCTFGLCLTIVITTAAVVHHRKRQSTCDQQRNELSLSQMPAGGTDSFAVHSGRRRHRYVTEETENQAPYVVPVHHNSALRRQSANTSVDSVDHYSELSEKNYEEVTVDQPYLHLDPSSREPISNVPAVYKELTGDDRITQQ